MENRLSELTVEIEKVKLHLQNLRIEYDNHFNELYKTIKVYPGKNIVPKIKIETGFHCYHEPSQYGRGTHVIVIPYNKFSEELKKQLHETYDDL